MSEFIIQRFYYSARNPWVDMEKFGSFKTLAEARKALLEDAKTDPNGIDWATGMNAKQDGRNWRIVERTEKVYQPFEKQ